MTTRIWETHDAPPELAEDTPNLLPDLTTAPADSTALLDIAVDEQLDGVAVARNVGIPARDGVLLGSDLYFPSRDGRALSGPWPVVLQRTPYGKHRTELVGTARALVSAGYAVAIQDVRGRFASQGQFYPFGDEGLDGYDTVAWIADQPWCDGHIGTMGGSYDGCTQTALAALNPPGLASQVVAVGPFNYHSHSMRQGGCLEQRFYVYALRMATTSREAHADPGLRAALGAVDHDEVGDWLARAPLRPGVTPLARIPSYEAWVHDLYTKSRYDEYWMRPGYTVEPFLEGHADVPSIFLGSWYDSYAANTCRSYAELSRRKKGPFRLIMGPWVHYQFQTEVSGDVGFGAQAVLSYDNLRRRWFDATLRDRDDGILGEPPVKIFVMGGGSGRQRIDGHLDHGGYWRAEEEWPPARTVHTPLYLHSEGSLEAEPSPVDSTVPTGSTSFRFDPTHPVPTVGGCISAADDVMPPGGFDQRAAKGRHGSPDGLPLAAREDVVVFQTPPLEHDVEVTGPIEARLYVSSDAPDTDFTAKLIDVYPPNPDYPLGYALNIQDGIQRMRFREDRTREVLMTPGEIYEVTIHLYPTSNVFVRGHRIRLDVSSSNFPRFDVNPNTGDPLGTSRRHRVAENTLWHSSGHPSCLRLPVIPK